MSVVRVDEKGRVLLGRELRKRLGLDDLPSRLLAIPKRDSVELRPIGKNLERAMEIARRKLRGWREEEHRGEKLLLGELTR